MKQVVIGIGSNTGDKRKNVVDAIEFLRQNLYSLRASSIYPTVPEGNATKIYDNAVVVARTSLSLEKLNSLLKTYEINHGRTPLMKKEDIVPIDLDIVLFGEFVVRPGDLLRNYFKIGYNQLFNV